MKKEYESPRAEWLSFVTEGALANNIVLTSGNLEGGFIDLDAPVPKP